MKYKIFIMTFLFFTHSANSESEYKYEDGAEAYNVKDYKSAYTIFNSLAENGDPKAQSRLGWMYEKGQGSKQSYHRAYQWYLKAAEQGHVDAQGHLGVMYMTGRGVRQDNSIAKEWFGKTCDSGWQPGCDLYRKLNEAGY